MELLAERMNMIEVLILLLSVFLGAMGYLVATFWMAPILRYHEIRHEVTADVIYYRNAIAPTPNDTEMQQRYDARRGANRKHAAELVACYNRLPWWYTKLLKFKHEEPMNAAPMLIGLSNVSREEDAEPRIKYLKQYLRIKD
jgi:hypothetical protein